jgi:hypothetical protein
LLHLRSLLAGYLPLLLLLAIHAPPGTAQSAAAEGGLAPARGEELSVYVMTMGPGRAVWERFGHNAIWIRDHRHGTDIAYNWGMFSFEQENFILRFIRGHMDYWMDGFDAELTASAYIRDDRSVWAQELNLTPAQRADLRDFLEWNALPENSVYRYDYYRDNCSTRVRDAIDQAIGGQLRAATEGVPTGTTYRLHTRALTAGDPPLYMGLMIGLGQPVDREISAWEEMFLPMQLRERIRDVFIETPEGERVPLVLGEVEIHRSAGISDGGVPGSRVLPLMLIGLLIGGAMWGAARWADSRRGARIAASALAAVWATVSGVLGLVLLGLWVATDHATSYWNENLFFYTPLLLPLAVLVPLATRGRTGARRYALWLALAVAALSILGLVLQVVPAFYQVTGETAALAIPLNLGLAAAAFELHRASSGPVREREPRARPRRRTAAPAA